MSSKNAKSMWRFLNGIFCVYKPNDITSNQMKSTIKFNLSRDLNEIDNGNRERPRILIEGGRSNDLSVNIISSYVDNPLVTGPRFRTEDFKMLIPHSHGKYSSGVMLIGVGKEGIAEALKIRYEKLLRVYEISARFGRSTDSGWAGHGKTTMKSKHLNVHIDVLNKVLAASQASHQRQAFLHSNIDPQSQEAYELAKEGIFKPFPIDVPFVLAAKCTSLSSPDFTLELHMLGETEEFILSYVEEIARRVRSVAACTKIRCIKFGPFKIEHTLARNQWNCNNILNNINQSNTLLNQLKSDFDKKDKTIYRYSSENSI